MISLITWYIGRKCLYLQYVKMKINILFSFLQSTNMEQKQAIISKINRSKKVTIFLRDSFMPIDTRHAANVLAELAKVGKLVRVAFGIYVKPVMSSFGPVMPTPYEIAEAVAKRDDAKLLPHGTTAENYLGFSTQVPMNIIYLTSGTSRKLKIGNRIITLKHRVPSTFAYKGKIMPVLVLALQSIGQSNITDETLDVVYGVLKKNPEESTWQEDIAHAPNWIRLIIMNTKAKIYGYEQMD